MKIYDITKKVESSKNIYQTLADCFDPFKDEKLLSHTFLIDYNNIKIHLSYPGRKLIRKEYSNRRKFLYNNVYDFQVEALTKNTKYTANDLSWINIFLDFEKFKRNNEEYYRALRKLYLTNEIDFSEINCKTDGMPFEMLLPAIKYIWIQEDLNYLMNSDHFKCPTLYRNKNTGIGRKLSWAKFILLIVGDHTAKECMKI